MMGRLLVAYSNASNFVSTTAEYLDSFASYSDFEVRYVHVTNDAKLDFNLDEFDAVFQSYCVRLPIDNYVSPDYIEKMKSSREESSCWRRKTSTKTQTSSRRQYSRSGSMYSSRMHRRA